MTSWVTEHLPITLSTSDAPDGLSLTDLVGLALRLNPRRVQLLVSTVLGKHTPVDPRLVYGAGRLLGVAVAERLGVVDPGTAAGWAALIDQPATLRDATLSVSLSLADVTVLGNAETATGLGHAVADVLGARYLHSTRRPTPGLEPIGGYAEPQSHAAEHLLQPAAANFFAGDGVLVIVDDELSTGVTALNTIRTLHARWPRSHYLVASLVDVRETDELFNTAESELAVCIDVVSLVRGRVSVPSETAAAAQRHLLAPTALTSAAKGVVEQISLAWPAGLAESGRHGVGPSDRDALTAALPVLLDGLAFDGPLQVLGTEEFMYTPMRVAEALADRGLDVVFSSTTRSPVAVIDEPGYPIRSALIFPAFDGQGPRYAYNIDPQREILVVTDTHEPGLLDQLSRAVDRVHVAMVPARPALPEPQRGPTFGSYQADEVGWLLSDLSDVVLEAPTEEREEAIQSGGAHYAESLPIEYQPSAEYQSLFREALADSAARLAHAVGVVTEIVLAERGQGAVLASLARAGTPVGILMRRWAAFAHDLDLPHYSISIVRGRGLDDVALRWLATHYDSRRVVFVDGWTGKGAIARELAAALGPEFDPRLAVLADPGSCAPTFGTREDFLIPSACLNSTVSGLVSRTVLNHGLIGPADFHGAKYYRGLAPADESAAFLDAVTARFASVAVDVQRDWPTVADSDRTPTWAGWGSVERLTKQYDLGSPNLVKPGVGETTRVLLRRVPWRILMCPSAGVELKHILLLAEQRGVPVEEVEDLPYACVGLIHPGFVRGARDGQRS